MSDQRRRDDGSTLLGCFVLILAGVVCAVLATATHRLFVPLAIAFIIFWGGTALIALKWRT